MYRNKCYPRKYKGLVPQRDPLDRKCNWDQDLKWPESTLRFCGCYCLYILFLFLIIETFFFFLPPDVLQIPSFWCVIAQEAKNSFGLYIGQPVNMLSFQMEKE